MGANSTDALYKAFHDFLKQCKVVGDEIVTPLDMQEQQDTQAGGQRLPFDAQYGVADQVDGRPDYKRGQ